MSEKRVYEGVLKEDNWEKDSRWNFLHADDGKMHTIKSWLEGLYGKRIRVTVEVIDE